VRGALLVGFEAQLVGNGESFPDRYRRTLASLVAPDGNVADILIREGFTIPYKLGFEAVARRAPAKRSSAKRAMPGQLDLFSTATA
jgi:hypothetical protein